MRPIAHLKTIMAHRRLVCRYCLRLGLVYQGLTHDLSKFSPIEFWSGARYYTGDRSPNENERDATGVSQAWLHHKGRNRHHFEYWIDYVVEKDGSVTYKGNKMPIRYVAEMFCDRVAASRIYLGDAYTDAAPYNYLMKGIPDDGMHPETQAELEEMLHVLKDEGEEAAIAYVKKRLKEAEY